MVQGMSGTVSDGLEEKSGLSPCMAKVTMQVNTSGAGTVGSSVT